MITTLLTLALFAATADQIDLTGRVVNATGESVAGARVAIDSATVRQGTSPLCPSCYADCRKSARTDDQGRFRIAALDPELLFHVLVIADGYQPALVQNVDPAKGPVNMPLTALDLDKLAPGKILRGVVVDREGKPVVGAQVAPQMFETEAYSGFRPGVFDPLAVTDLRGEFVLTANSPITSADLRVTGSGVAPRIVGNRRPEGNPHRIVLSAGATVTGRLVRDGKPVAGAAIGLVQADRSSTTFLGHQTIGTDAAGRFTFLNVHPDDNYFVYALMESMKDAGAVAAQPVHVGGDGTTRDAGDLAVIPGHRIAGQVILSDGKVIPSKTRLLVSREDAWDSQTVTLDPDGRFTVVGLPTERYSLSVRLNGYHLSSRNRSTDAQNPYRLVGKVDQDIVGLKILMEPGSQ